MTELGKYVTEVFDKVGDKGLITAEVREMCSKNGYNKKYGRTKYYDQAVRKELQTMVAKGQLSRENTVKGYEQLNQNLGKSMETCR